MLELIIEKSKHYLDYIYTYITSYIVRPPREFDKGTISRSQRCYPLLRLIYNPTIVYLSFDIAWRPNQACVTNRTAEAERELYFEACHYRHENKFPFVNHDDTTTRAE